MKMLLGNDLVLKGFYKNEDVVVPCLSLVVGPLVWLILKLNIKKKESHKIH